MIPVSERFLTELRETHALSVAAHVYLPSDLETPIQVPVIGGQMTADRDARVRRQATLEVTFELADRFTPEIVRELPYGGYATLERGILFPDGTVERVQLGRFRVESIVWTQLEGHATLTLADRMAQVQDEPFGLPWSPAGLHPSEAAIEAVRQVFGDTIQYHVRTDPGSEPTITSTVYDEDRATAISDLARGVGAEALFDHLGDFVIQPTNRSPDPVWTVDVGHYGVMLAATETLDRSSVRNGVAMRGQPDPEIPPVYALATFTDPTSPVRWGGPFGKVALIAESTTISTEEQAQRAAESLLNLRLGLARTVTIDTVPNPALEPEDVIEVRFLDGRVERQAVNSVAIGLDAEGALEITTTNRDRPDLEPLIRVATGRTAWAELNGARLVPA